MIYTRQNNTFMFEGDSFAKTEQNMGMIMDDGLLITKLLQTKPQMKEKII